MPTEFLLWAGGILSVFVLIVVWGRKKDRERLAPRWEEIGQILGLSLSTVDGHPRLTGTVDGAEVSIRHDAQWDRWVLRVSHSSWPGDLVLENSHATAGFVPSDRMRIRTGDRHFDEVVRVSGDELYSMAMLGYSDTRKLVTALVSKRGVDLRDGAATVKLDPERPEHKDAAALVKEMVKLGSAFARAEASVPDMLAHHAVHEKPAWVRLRALDALLKVARHKGVSTQTARTCLEDKHPSVRLRAGLHLGQIKVIVEAAMNSEVTADERLRAFAWLQKRHPEDASLLPLSHMIDDSTAVSALDHEDRAVAAGAADVLRRRGTPMALRALEDLTRRDMKENAETARSENAARLRDTQG